MRKSSHLILILSIFVLITTDCLYSQSGWFPSQTGFTNDYYSVHFEDNFTGWVSGSGGKILKTTNGGLLWLSQISNTNVNLRSINFVSIDAGFACGDNGTIVKTISSGASWTSINSGITSNLNTMFFVNPSTGWIAGDNGIILKTTNAGNDWFIQQTGVTVSLKSVHFTTSNSGWAVGSSGKILKTTNGGANWQLSVDLGPITTLHAVQFIDALTGYIAGEYTNVQGIKFVFFYKTINRGEWWLYQFSGVNTTIRSMYFSNSLNGWAAGDSGVILGTINGGNNWIGQPSHVTSNLNSICFTSPIYGWVSGNSGTVLKTINGGCFDTLNTSRRDLGVIPLVINSSNVLDAKYRIMFRAPDTSYNILRSLNNGVSYDTMYSHLSFGDTGKAFDGLLVRVKKIKFDPAGGLYVGNAGVVKDPVLPADSIQTRQYGWDYNPPQNRNLEGGKLFITGETRPWQSVSMSLSYPSRSTFSGFRSLLNPEDLRKVKIVFTGYGTGQQAYRYVAVSYINYQFQDMKEVPFKVFEIEPYDGTPNPRQLNCAFLEFSDSSVTPNGKWEPTTDSTGGKDVLYIFGSDYDPNPNSFYTSKNLLLSQPQIDVMYAWNAKLINSGAAYHVNDELIIYPYTVTRTELAPGYPLFYEFQTYSMIGIKKISNEVPGNFMLHQNYPNPFNPKTKIKFSIPKIGSNSSMDVNIKVYDILGREVSVIVDEKLLPGEYETEFNGNNLSSGVYFYKLQAGDYFETKKMVLIK